MVPNGWSSEQLGALVNISGGTTPSRDEPSYWDGHHCWLTPTDVTKASDSKLYIDDTSNKISDKALAETGVKLMPIGSVLMTSRATIGDVVINSVPMATNQGFCNFLPSSDLLNTYLAYWLRASKGTLKSISSGSTFLEVSKTALKDLQFLLPPLPEQKRIAEVLGSVDAAIETTRAVIEQAKKVKQGLLQALLTQGIGHTKFKDSPLGKIPEGWEVKPLIQSLDFMTDFVANGSFASLKSGVTVNDGDGYAFYVRLYDLRRGLGHQDQKYVDKTSYDFLGKSKLVGNEILIANIGANVGEIFLMPIINKPATIAPNMIVLKVKPALSHKYLYHFLRSDLGQKSISMAIAGSGQPKMNKTDLKKIWVICPPQNEQNIIADIFECLDEQSAAEMTKLTTLQQLKKGLMHDLLTGKVRVSLNKEKAA